MHRKWAIGVGSIAGAALLLGVGAEVMLGASSNANPTSGVSPGNNGNAVGKPNASPSSNTNPPSSVSPGNNGNAADKPSGSPSGSPSPSGSASPVGGQSPSPTATQKPKHQPAVVKTIIEVNDANGHRSFGSDPGQGEHSVVVYIDPQSWSGGAEFPTVLYQVTVYPSDKVTSGDVVDNFQQNKEDVEIISTSGGALGDKSVTWSDTFSPDGSTYTVLARVFGNPSWAKNGCKNGNDVVSNTAHVNGLGTDQDDLNIQCGQSNPTVTPTPGGGETPTVTPTPGTGGETPTVTPTPGSSGGDTPTPTATPGGGGPGGGGPGGGGTPASPAAAVAGVVAAPPAPVAQVAGTQASPPPVQEVAGTEAPAAAPKTGGGGGAWLLNGD